ncbi:hypothetical protein WJX82_001609 [Trebouxia sp. C0006]
MQPFPNLGLGIGSVPELLDVLAKSEEHLEPSQGVADKAFTPLQNQTARKLGTIKEELAKSTAHTPHSAKIPLILR